VILIDTSVWIEHLARGSKRMASLLEDGGVLQHPFVTGELACGSLHGRQRMLLFLSSLPQAEVIEHQDVLRLLDAERLHGHGLSWVDLHILASAMSSTTLLWTHDRALERAADRLGLAA
jgi:predicted nucleic acid-binding protein